MKKDLCREPAAVIEPGSVLGVKRELYEHYGILLENGKVIHYTSGASDASSSNSVSMTSFARFLRGESTFWKMVFPTRTEAERRITMRLRKTVFNEPAIMNLLGSFPMIELDPSVFLAKSLLRHYCLYSPVEILERAHSRLGERKYNLVTKNCEHFAFWCATGLSHSQQVEAFLSGGLEFAKYIMLFSKTFKGLSSGSFADVPASPLFQKESHFKVDLDERKVVLIESDATRKSPKPITAGILSLLADLKLITF